MRLYLLKRTGLWRVLVVLLGIGLFLTPPPIRAEDHQPDRILFLHVKIKNGVVSLLNSSITPGKLKPTQSKERKRPFQFVVENNQGQPLWDESMDEPTIERYEAPDPTTPGGIQGKRISREEVEFTIRIPVKGGMHHVSFYRETQAAAGANLAATTEPSRKLVGKIEIPTMPSE